MNENTMISITDLKMKYAQDYVLNGINLEIEKGQIIGYIGPNGAGKTTTIKILLGMIEEFEGSVKIFDKEISAADIAAPVDSRHAGVCQGPVVHRDDCDAGDGQPCRCALKCRPVRPGRGQQHRSTPCS